jgi:hypothetical protein
MRIETRLEVKTTTHARYSFPIQHGVPLSRLKSNTGKSSQSIGILLCFSKRENSMVNMKALILDSYTDSIFLELYEKDAIIGHQAFDLKMTVRVNMSMVGVPESSFDFWAAQFIAKG